MKFNRKTVLINNPSATFLALSLVFNVVQQHYSSRLEQDNEALVDKTTELSKRNQTLEAENTFYLDMFNAVIGAEEKVQTDTTTKDLIFM